VIISKYVSLQRIANDKDRVCLGQQFALTEAGYVIVRLLQRFDKLDNSAMYGLSDDWFLTLTGRPLHGVNLRFHIAKEN
jgi:cytochrome P450